MDVAGEHHRLSGPGARQHEGMDSCGGPVDQEPGMARPMGGGGQGLGLPEAVHRRGLVRLLANRRQDRSGRAWFPERPPGAGEPRGPACVPGCGRARCPLARTPPDDPERASGRARGPGVHPMTTPPRVCIEAFGAWSSLPPSRAACASRVSPGQHEESRRRPESVGGPYLQGLGERSDGSVPLRSGEEGAAVGPAHPWGADPPGTAAARFDPGRVGRRGDDQKLHQPGGG